MSAHYTFLVHPDNLDRVRAMLAEIERPYRIGAETFRVFACAEVRASPAVPRFRRRWVPPAGRFWEMEPADEPWAAKLGFGRYEDTDEPVVYKIDNRALGSLFNPFRLPGVVLTNLS